MIKAVLFDFDHTLYEREETIRGTGPELRRLLSDFVRAEVTEEQFTEALVIAETSENGYYFNGYQGVCDELERLGMFAIKPEKAQYCEHFYPTMSKNIHVSPAVYELLARLRREGYKLGLLTNGYIASQQGKLQYTRLPEYMDEIIISEELGKQKPHPSTFIAMCQRLGVRTDEAVYVGDNIISDICGARGAGLVPVWKPFAREWPEYLAPPAYTIKELDELPAVLEGLK